MHKESPFGAIFRRQRKNAILNSLNGDPLSRGNFFFVLNQHFRASSQQIFADHPWE
jgi:hypothetical protein